MGRGYKYSVPTLTGGIPQQDTTEAGVPKAPTGPTVVGGGLSSSSTIQLGPKEAPDEDRHASTLSPVPKVAATPATTTLDRQSLLLRPDRRQDLTTSSSVRATPLGPREPMHQHTQNDAIASLFKEVSGHQDHGAYRSWSTLPAGNKKMIIIGRSKGQGRLGGRMRVLEGDDSLSLFSAASSSLHFGDLPAPDEQPIEVRRAAASLSQFATSLAKLESGKETPSSEIEALQRRWKELGSDFPTAQPWALGEGPKGALIREALRTAPRPRQMSLMSSVSDLGSLLLPSDADTSELLGPQGSTHLPQRTLQLLTGTRRITRMKSRSERVPPTIWESQSTPHLQNERARRFRGSISSTDDLSDFSIWESHRRKGPEDWKAKRRRHGRRKSLTTGRAVNTVGRHEAAEPVQRRHRAKSQPDATSVQVDVMASALSHAMAACMSMYQIKAQQLAIVAADLGHKSDYLNLLIKEAASLLAEVSQADGCDSAEKSGRAKAGRDGLPSSSEGGVKGYDERARIVVRSVLSRLGLLDLGQTMEEASAGLKRSSLTGRDAELALESSRSLTLSGGRWTEPQRDTVSRHLSTRSGQKVQSRGSPKTSSHREVRSRTSQQPVSEAQSENLSITLDSPPLIRTSAPSTSRRIRHSKLSDSPNTLSHPSEALSNSIQQRRPRSSARSERRQSSSPSSGHTSRPPRRHRHSSSAAVTRDNEPALSNPIGSLQSRHIAAARFETETQSRADSSASNRLQPSHRQPATTKPIGSSASVSSRSTAPLGRHLVKAATAASLPEVVRADSLVSAMTPGQNSSAPNPCYRVVVSNSPSAVSRISQTAPSLSQPSTKTPEKHRRNVLSAGSRSNRSAMYPSKASDSPSASVRSSPQMDSSIEPRAMASDSHLSVAHRQVASHPPSEASKRRSSVADYSCIESTSKLDSSAAPSEAALSEVDETHRKSKCHSNVNPSPSRSWRSTEQNIRPGEYTAERRKPQSAPSDLLSRPRTSKGPSLFDDERRSCYSAASNRSLQSNCNSSKSCNREVQTDLSEGRGWLRNNESNDTNSYDSAAALPSTALPEISRNSRSNLSSRLSTSPSPSRLSITPSPLRICHKSPHQIWSYSAPISQGNMLLSPPAFPKVESQSPLSCHLFHPPLFNSSTAMSALPSVSHPANLPCPKSPNFILAPKAAVPSNNLSDDSTDTSPSPIEYPPRIPACELSLQCNPTARQTGVLLCLDNEQISSQKYYESIPQLHQLRYLESNLVIANNDVKKTDHSGHCVVQKASLVTCEIEDKVPKLLQKDPARIESYNSNLLRDRMENVLLARDEPLDFRSPLSLERLTSREGGSSAHLAKLLGKIGSEDDDVSPTAHSLLGDLIALSSESATESPTVSRTSQF